jgi:hypothetical protein
MNYLSPTMPTHSGFFAITLSTVVNMIIGILWYNVFFKKVWMQLIKKDKNLQENKFEESIKERWPYTMAHNLGSSFVCSLIKTYFLLHWLTVLGIGSACDALHMALCF